MHVVNILLILTLSNEAILVIHVVKHFVSNTLCQHDLYQVYYHSIAVILNHVGRKSEDIYIPTRLDVTITRSCSYKELTHHFSIWLVHSIVDSIQLNHHSLLRKHQLHIIHIHSLTIIVTLHV